MNPAPPVTMMRIQAPLILRCSSQLRYVARSPLLFLGAAAALGAAATQPLGSDVRLLVLCASVARMSGARILRELTNGPLNVDLALARAHAWALEQLRLRLPEPSATILAGELWGERASLPPELRTEFQETGTVHVLVTAGLHLGVVAALVLALFRALTVQRGVACAIAIAAIWAYAIFS